MTFQYKTRINPATGKAETYCDDATDVESAKEKLARDKRELRDMLAGNLPFHEDPNAAPAPTPTGEVREDGDPLDFTQYLTPRRRLPDGWRVYPGRR